MWNKIKRTAKRVWKWIVATVAAIVAAVAAFFGFDADAQATPVVDTVSWTMPTQYTDGSAIPSGTLTGTRIAWDTSPNGSFSNTVDVALPATSRQFTRAETYGRRCYKAAALVGTTNGEWSAAVCKTVQAPPRAPSNLTVE